MKFPFALLTLSLLAGCSSEDIETANFGSSYYHNQYLVSNLSKQDINLYMANRSLNGDHRNPFKDKYRVVSSLQDQGQKQVSHEHNFERRVIVGIETPFSLSTNREQLTHKVDNNRDYHLIVMPTGNSIAHTLVKRSDNTNEGVITVRILTMASDITLLHGTLQEKLIPGKVTESKKLENCTEALQINNQALDVCDGSFGRNYIAVVDEHGLLGLIKEQW